MINLNKNSYYKKIQEKMPHIAEKVFLMWGYPELRTYLLSLMNDTRGGTRAGFPYDIAQAILKLMELHDEQYPQYAKDTDVWGVR